MCLDLVLFQPVPLYKLFFPPKLLSHLAMQAIFCSSLTPRVKCNLLIIGFSASSGTIISTDSVISRWFSDQCFDHAFIRRFTFYLISIFIPTTYGFEFLKFSSLSGYLSSISFTCYLSPLGF